MNIIWYQLKIVISTRCKSNEKHMIKMKILNKFIQNIIPSFLLSCSYYAV